MHGEVVEKLIEFIGVAYDKGLVNTTHDLACYHEFWDSSSREERQKS